MNKQINLLKKASKKEKDAKILKRILMVLYNFKKETIRDVGKRLNCSHPTVLYWKRRYEKEGRLKVGIKLLLSVIYRLFLGEIRSDVFKYNLKYRK
mgnify:CR=1 FL=1